MYIFQTRYRPRLFSYLCTVCFCRQFMMSKTALLLFESTTWHKMLSGYSPPKQGRKQGKILLTSAQELPIPTFFNR